MKWFSKSLIGLCLMAIFASGAVSGWFVGSKKARQIPFTAPRPDEISRSFREGLHERLNLTGEQATKIDSIVDRYTADVQGIHFKHIGAIFSAVSNRNAQILAILNSEQQKIFDQFEKERHERRGPPPGWSPGPPPGWNKDWRPHAPGTHGEGHRERAKAECATNSSDSKGPAGAEKPAADQSK